MSHPASGRPRDAAIDAAVVAGTRELLVEVGYQRLTLGMIAERAGTNRPALYRRWPSKAHLVHDAVFPSAPEAPMPAGSFAEELRHRIHRLAASYGRPEAREAILGLLADLRASELRASVIEGLQRQARDEFAERVRRAVAEGEVRPDVDSNALLDVVIGALLQRIVAQQSEDPAFADQLTDLLLCGLEVPTPAT
jgi:AcrR family transcriptional regulator